VKLSKWAIVSLLLTAAVATPSTAQEARMTPQAAGSEACSGCFAHLEFPPASVTDTRAGIQCGGPYVCTEYGSGSRQPTVATEFDPEKPPVSAQPICNGGCVL
jgi:hypothetical protein